MNLEQPGFSLFLNLSESRVLHKKSIVRESPRHPASGGFRNIKISDFLKGLTFISAMFCRETTRDNETGQLFQSVEFLLYY